MYRFAVLLFVVAVVYGQDDGPPTVDELDVEKYIGRWYQVSRESLLHRPIHVNANEYVKCKQVQLFTLYLYSEFIFT